MSDQRSLTAGEVALARSVFGSTIRYADVHVYRRKYHPFHPVDTTITPDGNLYFHPQAPHYRADFSTASNGLKAHFIHEMTHVWQNHQGVNVIFWGILQRTYKYTLDR